MMRKRLENRVETKVFLICTCFTLSILGFMIKLPTSFRHYDKELHFAFYFIASVFLNLIFANRKIVRHLLIFGSLFVFGVCIEFAQEYSNKIFYKRIHGRFDSGDIQSNLKGLIVFTIFWIFYIVFFFNKQRINESINKG